MVFKEAKINRNPKIWDFLCWMTKAKAKENLWDFIYIRKSGLLLWLVRAQHENYESKCKRKSRGIDLPFHYESESEINLQILICNHFCVNGTYIKTILGELIFGSLHRFYVVHCASRNYTLNAHFFPMIDGVSDYIEQFWRTYFHRHYINFIGCCFAPPSCR